jgi:hypothetical protein
MITVSQIEAKSRPHGTYMDHVVGRYTLYVAYRQLTQMRVLLHANVSSS